MKKNTMNRLFGVLLAVGAATLILAACDNSYGVLHEIQTEKAQIGTDVFKNSTVKALGVDGTNYYAAMAKVYTRTIGGNTWSVLSIDGNSDYYCSGFVSSGAGSIFVATANTVSGAATGIYTTANSGTSWTRMDSSEFTSKIVDALFYANGTLFVTAHTETESAATYALYYWNGISLRGRGQPFRPHRIDPGPGLRRIGLLGHHVRPRYSRALRLAPSVPQRTATPARLHRARLCAA